MTNPAQTIRPNHRRIKSYYQTLTQYHTQGITHETALRSAFQNLLADVAGQRNWTLIPELAHPSPPL